MRWRQRPWASIWPATSGWPSVSVRFFAGVGGGLFAMFANQAQAKVFTTAMTYEILLIVVIGGIGSISGSCIAAFLYVAASEWWLRFLDAETYIGNFKVPFLRTGFRMVVFSVIIMVVVLFFRKGIMGDKELPDLLKKRQKKAKKEAGTAMSEQLLRLDHITMQFGGVVAVDDLELEVNEGRSWPSSDPTARERPPPSMSSPACTSPPTARCGSMGRRSSKTTPRAK